MSDFFVSICVPTYNRQNELKTLFNSLSRSSNYQLVICDDGSTDESKAVIERYSSSLNIKYLYQQNAGRSVALKNAILNADGKYTILMDSDDYFLPGAIELVLSTLTKLEDGSLPADVQCLLFGTELIKDGKSRTNLPPDTITNFVAVRADLGIKHDLKEVVRTDLLKACIYDVPEGCRRVPTSLLWARVAAKSRCLSVSKAVAVKEYLPGGMTDRILALKTKYSKPMVELYQTLAESSTYSSFKYRLRSALLWARHAWHEGNTKPSKLWQWCVWPIGGVIYILDKRKLAAAEKTNGR